MFAVITHRSKTRSTFGEVNNSRRGQRWPPPIRQPPRQHSSNFVRCAFRQRRPMGVGHSDLIMSRCRTQDRKVRLRVRSQKAVWDRIRSLKWSTSQLMVQQQKCLREVQSGQKDRNRVQHVHHTVSLRKWWASCWRRLQLKLLWGELHLTLGEAIISRMLMAMWIHALHSKRNRYLKKREGS